MGRTGLGVLGRQGEVARSRTYRTAIFTDWHEGEARWLGATRHLINLHYLVAIVIDYLDGDPSC